MSSAANRPRPSREGMPWPWKMRTRSMPHEGEPFFST